mgnify:CR=1 FL=1
MKKEDKIERLKMISKYVRAKALETILDANNGHIGGNLSSVELLTTLYFGGLFNFDPENSKNQNRDRVLIRGHEGPLRYTIFSLLGFINPEELKTYRSLGSRLQGHEDMFETPGVDITPSGSLGMLLSYGVGSCIANKDNGLNSRTVVFLGDGEEQEGNISEAARNAASHELDNLICILDQNQKQLSRPTKDSDGKSDIRKIWEGYGWNVLEIENGNDVQQVLETYSQLSDIKKPTLVIAHTTKGLGVIGAKEHFSGYHTLSSVNNKILVEQSLQMMLSELKVENLDYNNISNLAISLVSKPLTPNKCFSKVDDSIYNYVAMIASKTRSRDGIVQGVSPRGSIAAIAMAKAEAFLRGNTYVLPSDIKNIIVETFAHRMVMDVTGAAGNDAAGKAIQDILKGIPVPKI